MHKIGQKLIELDLNSGKPSTFINNSIILFKCKSGLKYFTRCEVKPKNIQRNHFHPVSQFYNFLVVCKNILVIEVKWIVIYLIDHLSEWGIGGN